MRKVLVSSILALLFSLIASAQNEQGATNKPDPLPRDLEIQLALSALPPHLRDNANRICLESRQGI